MPLASFYSLQWYGPGVGAMVTQAAGAIEAEIKADARAASTSALGVGSVPFAKATRLVNAPATINASGSMPQALPKARARVASTIRVNELSQDDVTGAVWQAQVEPGKTFQAAMLELLAGGGGGGPSAASIADAILARNLGGSADGGRTVRDALRTMRNRMTVDKDTGVITVYAEDDTTVAWTATATFAKRDAVAGIDPA